MRKFLFGVVIAVLCLLPIGASGAVFAQSDAPAEITVPPLIVYTDYPSEVVGIGENVSIPLKLDTGTAAQIVHLDVQDLPDEWSATFKGGNHLVQSTYVRPDKEATVDLRLTLPDSVEPGNYHFEVTAASEEAQDTLPIEIMVQEKLPPSLNLTVDLPTVRGKPDSTFRYSATLKNEGDEDLNVDLLSETPAGFDVTFKSGGQDVSTLPVEANSTKSISIEADPLYKLPAATYPLTIHAQAGSVSTDASLAAEVVGQAELDLVTPDGRLSGNVRSGEETSVNLLLQNTGTSPASAIGLSSAAPNGWDVTFEPKDVAELAPGSQTSVIAHVKPADNAIAGDYVLTFRAQPKGSAVQSIDYRATVRTSTLWGISGLVLIAVAVGIVGLAVSRFGRR